MFTRRLLIAILASPMFFPVSCSTGAIPAAHGFSFASTRDLAAGEAPYFPPIGIPLVERAAPGAAVVFPAPQVPEALAQWPGLTPRLPPLGNTAGRERDSRVLWKEIESSADAELIEVRLVTTGWTRIDRYRATDAGIELLTSRVFTRPHAFAGFGVGVVFATVVYALARRAKRRLPPDRGFGRPRT